MKLNKIKPLTNQNITVLGRIGSGKTTTVKQLIMKSPKDINIIIDPNQEYKELLKDKFDNFLEFYNTVPTRDQWLQIYTHKDHSITVLFYDLDKDNFDKLCQAIFILGHCLLVIEETEMFASSSNISQGLSTIVHRGRHKEIDLICITRRPFSLNRLITSQSHMIIVFKFLEPRDIKYIQEFAPEYDPNKLKLLCQVKGYHTLDIYEPFIYKI